MAMKQSRVAKGYKASLLLVILLLFTTAVSFAGKKKVYFIDITDRAEMNINPDGEARVTCNEYDDHAFYNGGEGPYLAGLKQQDPIISVTALCPMWEGYMQPVSILHGFPGDPYVWTDAEDTFIDRYSATVYCYETTGMADPEDKFTPARIILLCLDHDVLIVKDK